MFQVVTCIKEGVTIIGITKGDRPPSHHHQLNIGISVMQKTATTQDEIEDQEALGKSEQSDIIRQIEEVIRLEINALLGQDHHAPILNLQDVESPADQGHVPAIVM